MLAEILLVHLAAMASPGPNVLLVGHTALVQSRGAGLWTAAGVATGAFVWSASVALGLGLLFAGTTVLYDIVRVAGGAYLIVIGARMVRHAKRHLRADTGVWRRSSGLGAWARGGMTNLSNPKAAVFYLSIFSTMLPAHASVALRSAAVGLISANALIWHSLVAAAFSTGGARDTYLRCKPWVDRVSGTVMATFGLLFAADVL